VLDLNSAQEYLWGGRRRAIVDPAYHHHLEACQGREGWRERAASSEYAKEDPDGWSVDFRLEQVELGKDEDGDPITSCIVREGEAHQAAPAKTKRLQDGMSNHYRLALQLLHDEAYRTKKWEFTFAEAADIWISCGVAMPDNNNSRRSQAHRIRERLAVLKHIKFLPGQQRFRLATPK
jgi:hypothetical protein